MIHSGKEVFEICWGKINRVFTVSLSYFQNAYTHRHTNTHTHAHTETMATFTTTAAHDPTITNGYTDSNDNDHNNNDKQPELFGLVLLPDVSFFVVVYFWY